MTYNIFISHSWKYSNQYNNLINLLRAKPYFQFRDYSVPKDDPILDARNTQQLKNEIRNQIRPATCVIIPAGVYASYSKWINVEIELAKEMDKRIIAVIPRGADNISTVVRDAADKVVNWNTESIVNAIRGY